MNFSECGFPIFDDQFDISYLTDKPADNKCVEDKQQKPQDKKDKPKIKPLF